MGVPLVLLMVNEYHHIYGIGYYFGLFKVFDIVDKDDTITQLSPLTSLSLDSVPRNSST